jgi:hypothetical protein
MSFEFTDYKPEGYYLHLDKIVNATDLPTYLVRAGKELQESGYLTAGEFFEKLDDVEVLHLGVLMDSVHTVSLGTYKVDSDEAGKNLYHLSLLCFVLALGEGIVELDTNFIDGAMQALFVLIAVENMYRRGAVEVFRENFSIVESFKPVAKVIAGGKDEKPKGT